MLLLPSQLEESSAEDKQVIILIFVPAIASMKNSLWVQKGSLSDFEKMIKGWQLPKIKRRFFTCPCHKMYMLEAVDLFILLLNFGGVCEMMGEFHEKMIFCK